MKEEPVDDADAKVHSQIDGELYPDQLVQAAAPHEKQLEEGANSVGSAHLRKNNKHQDGHRYKLSSGHKHKAIRIRLTLGPSSQIILLGTESYYYSFQVIRARLHCTAWMHIGCSQPWITEGGSDLSIRFGIIASFWTYHRDHAEICLDLSSLVKIL